MGEVEMAEADRRRRLIEIVAEKSLSTGTVRALASGRSSTFYFDMKPTIFDPEAASIIAEMILERLQGRRVDFVGGLEMGAVPLVACVCLASYPGRPVRGFFVRKQAKDHGTRSLVEGLAEGETLEGKRIAMLEDVTTTGGSTIRAIEALRAEGGIVDRVITVVDRLEGAAETFKAAGIPFTALLTPADFR
jgi:orotate phosphoribosyltransferase